MEKPDILSRNSTRPKTGLFLTGKTRHFEPKLNTPENRTIPEWKNPFFFSISQQGQNTDHFLFLFSFRCRDDDWSNDDESDSDFDNMHEHDEYSHSEIIQRCNFGSKHLINARLFTQTCLQHQPDSSTRDATPLCLNSTNFDGDQKTEESIKTFPTMLKLINWTLVGCVKYNDLYNDLEENEDTSSTCRHANESDRDYYTKKMQCKIPTLPQVARRVARLEKTQLDEKQYIAYEMIACTFLLGLVNDGSDKNTKLGLYLQQTLEIDSITDATDIIKKLKARGGRDQLLMFLTGPAGSGKSTAMKIAQQYCYEFCKAVGIMWSDKTFIFTAYTGSAASLFGGVTISKAAFLNQRKQLSVDDRNEWQDVRIVVIDEVSFMSDTILKTLDRKLKEIKNRSQPFGGFTIIFAGDFRQLEPIGVNDTELLFSSLSSQHWENCINAVIILDNEHRFKEDPEYGQMLKRMWSGDLTKEDRMRINTRVLGSSGLELPPDFEGK